MYREVKDIFKELSKLDRNVPYLNSIEMSPFVNELVFFFVFVWALTEGGRRPTGVSARNAEYRRRFTARCGALASPRGPEATPVSTSSRECQRTAARFCAPAGRDPWPSPDGAPVW